MFCHVCGEPYDNDSLHDRADEVGTTYQKVASDWRTRGCEAIGSKHSAPSKQRDKTFGLTRQEAAGALNDIMGDDMDGTAAMLEDMGF